MKLMFEGPVDEIYHILERVVSVPCLQGECRDAAKERYDEIPTVLSEKTLDIIEHVAEKPDKRTPVKKIPPREICSGCHRSEFLHESGLCRNCEMERLNRAAENLPGGKRLIGEIAEQLKIEEENTPLLSNDSGNDSTPFITKADIWIEKFKWDPETEKKHKRLVFAELPDGRVMLSAWSARVYTTKERILKIPFPIPKGYMDTLGVSNNYEYAIRNYREYLAEQEEDDRFKPMLTNAFSTRPADHDGGKIGVV